MARKVLALLVLLLFLPNGPATQAHAYWHHARFFITGYTWTGNRTATGVWPISGRTVAVDPYTVPLGSWLYIAGLGWRRAEDTGGAIVGRHVDVFVNSVGQAYAITGWRWVTYR